MREDFLHYLWKYKRLGANRFTGTRGETITVLDFGVHNHDSGPDFFNARIRINETTWAGNVEIHLNSGDWKKHGHQHDSAYDNVILHVVLAEDEVVHRHDGTPIPCVEIGSLIDPELLASSEQLLKSKKWAACEGRLAEVNPLTITNWLHRLAVERLERKSSMVDHVLRLTGNHWEEAFYIMMARSFGFSVNTEPMEQLARSIPLSTIAKHTDDLVQVEALFFGQAGLLSDEFGEAYPQNLAREYAHLKAKYSLISGSAAAWKFSKLRPDNFPTVRIAQLARLLCATPALFSRVLGAGSPEDLQNIFKINLHEYWEDHYRFDQISVKRSKGLGILSINSLLINTVVPFLFVYGRYKGNEEISDRALSFLEQIEVEQNAVVTKWAHRGIRASNALDSQALLTLRNDYCKLKKCLGCNIGIEILKRND